LSANLAGRANHGVDCRSTTRTSRGTHNASWQTRKKPKFSGLKSDQTEIVLNLISHFVCRNQKPLSKTRFVVTGFQETPTSQTSTVRISIKVQFISWPKQWHQLPTAANGCRSERSGPCRGGLAVDDAGAGRTRDREPRVEWSIAIIPAAVAGCQGVPDCGRSRSSHSPTCRYRAGPDIPKS